MKKFLHKGFLALVFLSVPSVAGVSWGFFAHRQINRLAVFTLPAEMAGFYKSHIEFITEGAVLPDKRRYVIKEEAARHYIDLDYYEDSLKILLPVSWDSIIRRLPEDTLQRHGILPWHLNLMKIKLTEAFASRNPEAILKISADIGHYIADAHVPLHTCTNYNGQFTGQHGIHGLWESRLPELYFRDYDFFVGPARYIRNPSTTFWEMVRQSHLAADSVLSFEKNTTAAFPVSEKYAYVEKGASTVKTYSEKFCQVYHNRLSGQVESRMRRSVSMVGNIWFTCWVDAGQPELENLTVPGSRQPDAIKEGRETVPDDCVH